MDILKNYVELIEEELGKVIPELPNLQQNIYKSMNYSLCAGGKRLRPVLMLEINKICGGNAEEVIPFACAIEMIHTYSLIHDDLPAMDNDVLRRGKPTNHVVFGEANAILAGDALLTKAFELMAAANVSNKANQLKAIAYMASAAGTEGMIGGQVVDIECENKPIGIQTLKSIHYMKTGALIRAACVVGGIIAGADSEKIKDIEHFADCLGIAFQIRDDILDVTGTTKELGKPVGSDEKSMKRTYATILGIEESEKLCQEYTQSAIEYIKKLGDGTDFLCELSEKLVSRTK